MLIIFIACQFVVLGEESDGGRETRDDNANGVRCCAVDCVGLVLDCVGSLSGHWPRRQSFAHINRR